MFAKNETGVTERQIGFIFFVNTLAIVLAQLPFSKLLEGRRRMPALALDDIRLGGRLADRLRRRRLPRAGRCGARLRAGRDRLRARRMPSRADPGALVADLAPRRLRRPLHGALDALLGDRLRDRADVGGIHPPRTAPNALWPIAAVRACSPGCGALLLERRIPPELRVTPS